ALGEALRTQLSRLPEMPRSQELDRDIIQLRVERLGYEDMLENQDTFLFLFVTLSIVGFSLRTRKHYNAFLERVSNRIGKVTQ
ncbi:hypothetical protein KC966_18250, partial [Proteus terrae]|uniref:hypothetical protein n=1 Tax=Proteus terrae TaxID=1574161 RepID=UPI003315DBF1